MYAVFGNPIEHSLSPLIIYKSLNIECSKFSLKENISKEELKQFLIENKIFFGNVTYPYKSLFFKYSDKVIFPSNLIENVNSFIFIENKIISTNTDGEGFFLSLYYMYNDIYKKVLNNRIILIAGTGATSKSIGYSAKIRGIMPIYISRKTQYENLSEHLHFEKIINYKNASELLKKINCSIVVSALPFSVLKLIYENKNIKYYNSENQLIDIKTFFENVLDRNINIFDSNYKDYVELIKLKKQINIFNKIHYGIDQLIGQALLSLFFFTKKNFSNFQNFIEIKEYINKNLE